MANEYKLSYTASDINRRLAAVDDLSEAVANKIDSPTSAIVGQVLSVKSIDEEGNITWETVNPESVDVDVATDETLSVSGMAADAKAVGDAINNIKIETDNSLSVEGDAADAKATGDAIQANSDAIQLNSDAIAEINSKIADILYEAISITSFTNNIGTVEKGSTVANVTLSWKTNKAPTALALDGGAIDSALTSITTDSLSLTSNKTWTLVATDERDATSTRTTKITFLNGVYYGAIDSIATIDNAAILGLTKKLQSSKAITFTATANDGQYIVYALPEAYGTPAFNVGGFDGGFSLHSTFSFTNSSEHTESYCVWISDNMGLGETTVKVS